MATLCKNLKSEGITVWIMEQFLSLSNLVGNILYLQADDKRCRLDVKNWENRSNFTYEKSSWCHMAKMRPGPGLPRIWSDADSEHLLCVVDSCSPDS